MNQPLQDQQSQKSRTERAQYALHHGQFQITQREDSNWNVKNGDKQPYLVSKSHDDWVCNCEDFVKNRNTGVRCKHIEAVRLSQPEQFLSFAETTPSYPPTSPNSTKVITALSQPLNMERVKRRKAPNGTVPYLEGYDIIEQANRIFSYQWSFVLLSEPEIVRWEKPQLVFDQTARSKVPLEKNGFAVTETVGIVHITGKVSVILEGHIFEHSDIGRCIFTGDTPEALDMALAGCATDCLKRCFRQLGDQFGNSLYDKEIAKVAGTPPTTTHTTVGRVYRNGECVNGNVSEQEAFDRFIGLHHGAAPSSREALRQWLSAQEQHIETITAQHQVMPVN